MKEKLPKTVNCPHCQHESDRLDMYVYAHWDIELMGRCTGCGKQYGLKRGIAYGLPNKRKKS